MQCITIIGVIATKEGCETENVIRKYDNRGEKLACNCFIRLFSSPDAALYDFMLYIRFYMLVGTFPDGLKDALQR